MPNPYGAPEITVKEVEARQASGEQFVWLDVRESNEHAAVSIEDERIVLTPLSLLAAEQLAALPESAQPQDADIIVMCHHGNRSGQVTMWLKQQGWTNVLNMAGGIDAWAKEIDPTVGTY